MGLRRSLVFPYHYMCKQNLEDKFRHFRRNLDKMSYSAKCLLDEISFRRNRFRRNAIDPITRNLFSEMEKSGSRVEVDVYPRGGTFKHIAEC